MFLLFATAMWWRRWFSALIVAHKTIETQTIQKEWIKKTHASGLNIVKCSCLCLCVCVGVCLYSGYLDVYSFFSSFISRSLARSHHRSKSSVAVVVIVVVVGLMLEKTLRMLGSQVWAQCIDATVCCRAIWAHRPLCGVGMIMMPTICDLFAARSTSPHCAGIAWWREHIVIWHCMMVTNITAAAMQRMVMWMMQEARR